MRLDVDLQATEKAKALLGKSRHVAKHIPAMAWADARIIYSTSSASAETPKWRAIVPFLTAISGVHYEQLQRALFELLQTHGIVCDSAMQGPI